MACQTIDTVICGRPYRNIPFLLRRAKHNALPAAAFFLQKYIQCKGCKKICMQFCGGAKIFASRCVADTKGMLLSKQAC